ncbi:MAG: STAS domain-containing protein [Hylemonella sp.]|nr:STAS domain-containing protein [Hylemonella sp.]MDH5707758.1 STAS domain-containing protein [Hylemonella sp.]
MKIVVYQSGGRYRRITLDGEFDAPAVRASESELTAAMLDDADVIIDLRQVPSIDASGMRLLLSEVSAHADHGGKTVLLGVDAHTRRIFKATGIDQLVPVCDELEEAVSRF